MSETNTDTGPKSKLLSVIMVISVLFLISILLLIFFPIRIELPAFMEKKMIENNEKFCICIDRFKEENSRLPKSFNELDNSQKTNLSELIKEWGGDGKIIDYGDKNIVFEVEAVWHEAGEDRLVWAKTKSGEVIRFKEEVLQR